MGGYKKPPVLAIADLGLKLKDLRGNPIEQMARYGARLVLTACLEAEVTEFLSRERYEHTPEGRGYRNGHRKRGVTCGLGTIPIEYPKVADTEGTFESALLRAWQRKSEEVVKTLPSLYIEGLSTRDFDRGMKPLWEEAGVSRSTVSRANESIRGAFKKWRQRDLSQEDVLFLFLDGIYEGVRGGTDEKEAILVAHGLKADGKRVLLGVYLGVHEGTESWKLALDDLKIRNFRTPILVISDGSPGLIQAVKQAFPGVPRQRCVVHRTRNVLARVPRADQRRIRKDLNRIFHASCLKEALEAAEAFVSKYQEGFPSACEILGRDLEDCLTFYRFPQNFWKRIRNSNSLERMFREVRRRTRVVGRFPNELSALSLIWSVMDQQAGKWRGVRMKPEWAVAVREVPENLRKEPIVIRGFEEVLAS